MNIAVFFGTRPEAIKLAPVILQLRRRGSDPLVVTTGQHRELVDQTLRLFGVTPDLDLRLMVHGQTLDHILSASISRVGEVLDHHRPSVVIVQGDTTSTAGTALSAFHHRIPVAHIEAGLRSHDMGRPFPEELNRRVASLIARWHFAPTERGAENLRGEGVSGSIYVTGNTVVDALRYILEQPSSLPAEIRDMIDGHPYILATAHRRESWGGGIRTIAEGLRDVLRALPNYRLVFSLHPNPVVRRPVMTVFQGEENALIVDALPYTSFIRLLKGAALVVTDSGGIQEEAPTLGTPVIVTRQVTERPEGVDAGAVRVVGTERAAIAEEALDILRDPVSRERMQSVGLQLYGDGRAAARITDVLLADGARAVS